MSKATATRPMPPRMDAQPSQKKSCRPCSTPENSGIHKFISNAASVTHNVIGLVSSQPAMMRF